MTSAGLDYLVVMDFPEFETEEKEVLNHMLEYMPDVKGLFYMDYTDYAKCKGNAYFIDDKPVVSFKYRLWLPMDPMEKIAKKINQAPRDAGSLDGYSAVVVHAWSYDMDDVARFKEMLDDDVIIVGAHDFMNLINKNIKNNLK